MTLRTIPALLASLLLAGCATSPEISESALKAYLAYQAQPRSYSPFRIVAAKGQAMQVSISNVGELVTEAPLNPLSVLQGQQGKGAVDLLDSVLKYGLAGYGIYTAGNIAQPTIVNQPPPVIVEPVFAPVPAAP